MLITGQFRVNWVTSLQSYAVQWLREVDVALGENGRAGSPGLEALLTFAGRSLKTEPFFGLNQTPGLFAHLNHAAVLLRGVLHTA